MDLFIGWAYVSQGQHFDISWIMNMVYMNIIICWNIMMAMCIYYGPAIDVSVACRRLIISKPLAIQFAQFAKQNNQ